MGEKLGVEQIEKIVVAVAEVGKVIDEMVNEQGGIAKKLAHLVELGDDVLMLAQLDVELLKKQLGDLEASERAALVELFVQKFDMQNDSVEAKVEAGLLLAAQAGELVAKVVDFAKSFKQA